MDKCECKVSVIMSVFNYDEYLKEAIDSVLNQTFIDFEFIIIDDGSTDKTSKIIKSYKDRRIKVIQNIENIGIAKSINKGLEIAKGEYIARMDADDICLPIRLQVQVAYLDCHPEVGLCCSNMSIIDKSGRIANKTYWPPLKAPIEWSMLWYNPIAQSTVMMRKDVLEQNHLRYKDIYAEDFDLWCRMALETRIVRLDEVYLQYRIHDDSAYQSNQTKSNKQFNKSRIEYSKILSEIEPLESMDLNLLLKLREGINRLKKYNNLEDEQIINDICIRYSNQLINEINKLKEEHNKEINKLKEEHNKDEVTIANLTEEVKARKKDIETIKNSKTYKIADKMGMAYRKIRKIKP